MKLQGDLARGRNRLIAWLLIALAFFPVTGLYAETLTLDVAARLSLESSQEVLVLERTLRDQREDLGIAGYLDEITLEVSGSLEGEANSDTDAVASGSASLSGSLEVVPQVILNSRVTMSETTAETPGIEPDRVTAAFGVTLLPLADTTIRDREELAAETTAVNLVAARNSAQYSAIISLLDVVTAGENQAILSERQALAERSLDNVRALYERDRASDEQLEAAETAVRTGEAEIVRAELGLTRAIEVLARQIDLAPSEIVVPGADDLDLDIIVAGAEAIVAASPLDLALADPSVLRAELDVVAAELDIESARRLSPAIYVTATGGLPDWTYNLGAEISISPADWDGSAKADATSDLEFAVDELAYVTRLAEYDAQAALNDLKFALDELRYAQEDLEDARLDLSEADIRLSRGAITQLDRDQAAFGVAQAVFDVTSARLSVARHYYAIEFSVYQ